MLSVCPELNLYDETPHWGPFDSLQNKGKAIKGNPLVFVGAPSKIRTCDIQIRSLTLYPAEPWAQNFFSSNGGESGIRTRGTPLKGVQSLSRRSLSATQPSLRDLIFPFSRPGPLGWTIWRGSRIHIDRLSFRIFSIL
jgi:hypothetical protein